MVCVRVGGCCVMLFGVCFGLLFGFWLVCVCGLVVGGWVLVYFYHGLYVGLRVRVVGLLAVFFWIRVRRLFSCGTWYRQVFDCKSFKCKTDNLI